MRQDIFEGMNIAFKILEIIIWPVEKFFEYTDFIFHWRCGGGHNHKN